MLVVEDFKGIAVEGPSTAPVVDSGGGPSTRNSWREYVFLQKQTPHRIVWF